VLDPTIQYIEFTLESLYIGYEREVRHLWDSPFWLRGFTYIYILLNDIYSDLKRMFNGFPTSRDYIGQVPLDSRQAL